MPNMGRPSRFALVLVAIFLSEAAAEARPRLTLQASSPFAVFTVEVERDDLVVVHGHPAQLDREGALDPLSDFTSPAYDYLTRGEARALESTLRQVDHSTLPTTIGPPSAGTSQKLVLGFGSRSVAVFHPAYGPYERRLVPFVDLLMRVMRRVATQDARAVRLDVLRGRPVTLALRDRKIHTFRFPCFPGSTFDLRVEASPGRPVMLWVDEVESDDSYHFGVVKERRHFAGSTKAPVSLPLRSQYHGFVSVRLRDPTGDLGRATISARLTSRHYDTSRVSLFVHVTGDSYKGLTRYSDLSGAADTTRFVTDLLRGTNRVLASTGIQIDESRSGSQRISSDQVAALTALGPTAVAQDKHRGLVTRPSAYWGKLAVPANDAQYGRAIDVFVINDTPDLLDFRGECLCGSDYGLGLGGMALGGGPRSAIVIRAFKGRTARSTAELSLILAHELGHFLSLDHTGYDDIPDTHGLWPFNVMFSLGNLLPRGDTGHQVDALSWILDPFLGMLWTEGQKEAMRGYLAMMEH
jgi:hypothetical protein